MKTQLLTFILALNGFCGYAIAGHCQLTEVQRLVESSAGPQVDRLINRLTKQNISTSGLFFYRQEETEISQTRVDAADDRACFELAVAKANQMQGEESLRVELLPLRELNIEDRYIEAASTPVVRWKYNETGGWIAIPTSGGVTGNVITCNKVTDESFRGNRLYNQDCSRM